MSTSLTLEDGNVIDAATSPLCTSSTKVDRSRPTVAMPRGAAPCDAEELAVSSRDILSIRGGDARAPRIEPHADPLIGRVVADRYRILEPIGRGGMGSVYKVQHTRIGKLLAMKILSGELSQSADPSRRFQREALAVSRLHSLNTVQVFDFGFFEGATYLVMELVAGETLGRLLHLEGPMKFARLGKIIVQICSSLAEAHHKGIIHRDIKPENIMILPGDGAEVVKVLDFGLAKLREAEGLCEITSQGTILGTPYYMAPEQIRGEEVDARADIYSVGALMYRLLTGLHPFGGSPTAVLSKHLSEIPIPPAERAPHLGIPLGVSRIVMRALRKDPGDRFQRIEELSEQLVEELYGAGASSVASLLDPSRIRPLALDAGSDEGPAVATRDEVDAYERRLRRMRHGAVGLAAALLTAVVAGGSLFAARRDTRFEGAEVEPNNTAAEATAIPLGESVTAHLGKRIDASHGDRDFYAFDVPAVAAGEPGYVRLEVGALPNLPMCTMLYKPGFVDAIGQYCVGRAGRALVVPTLQLEPGRYLLGVMQDLSLSRGAPSQIHENVSDAYTVRVESTRPDPGAEIEPNDQVASANLVTVGRPRQAQIDHAFDDDVFCVSEAVSTPIRWSVRAELRDGGVLEATPLSGGAEGAPARIHGDIWGKGSSADVVSPWRSTSISAKGASRCLRLRMMADPWSAERGTPGGGSASYMVEAETSP